MWPIRIARPRAVGKEALILNFRKFPNRKRRRGKSGHISTTSRRLTGFAGVKGAIIGGHGHPRHLADQSGRGSRSRERTREAACLDGRETERQTGGRHGFVSERIGRPARPGAWLPPVAMPAQRRPRMVTCRRRAGLIVSASKRQSLRQAPADRRRPNASPASC